MGVSTWLAVVACVCTIQGISSFERQEYSAIAKMIGRRLEKKQASTTPSPTWSQSGQTWSPSGPTWSPTDGPGGPGPTGHAPIDFWQHWLDCPIMESILEQYFTGFPNTRMPKDSMVISPDEIKRVLTRLMATFKYLKNVRVAIDQMTEDMARLVLDKRVNCTTTMYQRVFVYYMRRRLDTMMAAHDTSLKSRIEQVLNQSFPDNPNMLHMAPELVWGVHHVVHETFIGILQEEEFESLDWFLRDYKWKATSFLERFHRGEFAAITDVISQMKNEFFSIDTTYYPDAFRCPSPQEFIEVHKRAANLSASYYWKARKSGLAVAFLTTHLQEMFSYSASVPNDPFAVDQAIQNLVHVVLDYVNGTMAELARYEDYLASATLSPPTFMANSLTGPQWNMTMLLFNRMFGNSVPPTGNPGPGPGMTMQEIVRYLQNDVDKLKKIRSMMPTVCTSTDDHGTIDALITDMVQDKENFINTSQSYGGYRK
ncbi:uncharacterized protein LOC132543670 [Ylistrum balloti]|uniref:uncharacterized protein LOC132543670 n=1 Tax=Ylistrum balloti TaxID=509963 RepID=UPI002905A52B|nr:uncharacterized protein LOC132543670 [Ylistrum balloti]